MSSTVSDHGEAPTSEHVDDLRRSLHLTRSELAWVRAEHEHMSEALQRVRRQRARLREQSEALASTLAAQLSAAYWREQQSGLSRLRPAGVEAQLARELEDHPLFDAGWYLRQHQQAIPEQDPTPALHHVRHANRRRLDPSEGFSTRRYLMRHPEVADSGLPALVHAQRHGLLDDGVVVVDPED